MPARVSSAQIAAVIASPAPSLSAGNRFGDHDPDLDLDLDLDFDLDLDLDFDVDLGSTFGLDSYSDARL